MAEAQKKNQNTEEGPSRWEILARERNARVVMCHTPDTYTLTELTRGADRAVRMLRDRVYTSISPEKAGPLFEEYNEAILNLHNVIKKISKKLDIRYRVPRTIKEMLKARGDDGSAENEVSPEQSTLPLRPVEGTPEPEAPAVSEAAV